MQIAAPHSAALDDIQSRALQARNDLFEFHVSHGDGSDGENPAPPALELRSPPRARARLASEFFSFLAHTVCGLCGVSDEA